MFVFMRDLVRRPVATPMPVTMTADHRGFHGRSSPPGSRGATVAHAAPAVAQEAHTRAMLRRATRATSSIMLLASLALACSPGRGGAHANAPDGGFQINIALQVKELDLANGLHVVLHQERSAAQREAAHREAAHREAGARLPPLPRRLEG